MTKNRNFAIDANLRRRMFQGAANYAAADRSDPFAFNRGMTHTLNGIASVAQDGRDAFYQATPAQEERFLPDGQSFHVTVYRNIERP